MRDHSELRERGMAAHAPGVRAFRDRLRDPGAEIIYSEGKAEAHGQSPFAAAAVQDEMNRFLDRHVGAGSWENDHA